MKFEQGLLLILLICAALFGADYMGWLPQPENGDGQATAVPVIIQVVMPTSEAVATPIPAPAATPELVIIVPPATWTANPNPVRAVPTMAPTATPWARLGQGCSLSRGTCPGQGGAP